MALTQIHKVSVAEEVFQQLSAGIVRGDWLAGQALPSERALAETMGVSRPLVREAVRRLEQAGLVAIRHGAGLTVRDFRYTAGLDLLPHLLLLADGEVDWQLVQSVMEMRTAIAPDAARLCAQRQSHRGVALVALAGQMRTLTELTQLQELMVQVFENIVEGSENVAYRLAYNSLRRVYDPVRDVMAGVLEAELRDMDRIEALGQAITSGDGELAAKVARELLLQGQHGVEAAIAVFRAVKAGDSIM